ncbi:SubName: Full=Uncharacterized protein {ECO:0000313/EMBL:CCA70222.1} [Serendipita indica DSM 11827]|nr:SubName: Full=Uncharacterized protein {ECO:0000313/EMBL:CCA70222.1} [Serendipita indica DSM 11827]
MSHNVSVSSSGMDDSDAHPEDFVQQPDGSLRCKRHGLEICKACDVDYTFIYQYLDDDDVEWKPDEPIEEPDGTLRCKRHWLEICGKSCVDYTFMREILEEERQGPMDSDSDDSGRIRKESRNPKRKNSKWSKCVVCKEYAPKQCSNCKTVQYCGAEHQRQHWSEHKAQCRKASQQNANSDSHGTKPELLLLSIGGYHKVVEEMEHEFISSLEPLMELSFTTNEDSALRRLKSKRPPAAVIVVDALYADEHGELVEALIAYTKGKRSKGGLVMFALGFPCFMGGKNMQELFEKFEMFWEMASYDRKVFKLNTLHQPNTGAVEPTPAQRLITWRGGSTLPEEYSMKALRIKGATSSEAVYLEERASAEALVETPLAMTRLGFGKVVYVGDVNNEAETQLVIRNILTQHLAGH